MPRNEPASCRACGHTTKIDRVGIGAFSVLCTHKGCTCTACRFSMENCASINKVIKKYNASRVPK